MKATIDVMKQIAEQLDADGHYEHAGFMTDLAEREEAQAVEPFAYLCVLPTKDAGPTKFFTAPSDPRGFPVFTHPAPQPSNEPVKLPEVVDTVIGCFNAAFTEGLHEALAETHDARLKDLVERRLMRALYAAQEYSTPSGPIKSGEQTGYVRVPVTPNAAMNEVMNQDDWEWADVLVAADAITEVQYEEALSQEPIRKVLMTDKEIVNLYMALPHVQGEQQTVELVRAVEAHYGIAQQLYPVKLTGEREALIGKLSKCKRVLEEINLHGPAYLMLRAADMLEADGRELGDLPESQAELLAEIKRLKAKQVEVPPGWKLVPIEPTPEMVKAGGHSNSWSADAKITYGAMLYVAPQPPQGDKA
jgi:hypothetical protein